MSAIVYRLFCAQFNGMLDSKACPIKMAIGECLDTFAFDNLSMQALIIKACQLAEIRDPSAANFLKNLKQGGGNRSVALAIYFWLHMKFPNHEALAKIDKAAFRGETFFERTGKRVVDLSPVPQETNGNLEKDAKEAERLPIPNERNVKLDALDHVLKNYDPYQVDMLRRIFEVLEAAPRLTEELAKKLGIGHSEFPSAEIVAKTPGTDPKDWLLCLYHAKQSLGEHERQPIVKLVGLSTPILDDNRIDRAVQDIDGENAPPVPILGVTSNLLTEIAMARIDANDVRLRTPPSENKRDLFGEFALSGAPESGRDKDGQQVETDLGTHLKTLFADDPTKVEEVLERGIETEYGVPDQYTETPTGKGNYLRDEIEYRWLRDERRFYYAVILQNDETLHGHAKKIMGKIKAKYPGIRFAILRDDQDLHSEEIDNYRSISDILRDES